MIKNLSYYLHCFDNLRRDRKNGGAPHKPILLISLIQLFELHRIDSNEIFVTPEIVGMFQSIWNKLVKSEHHMSFALPFYFMKSEPFWKLIPNQGCEKWVAAKSAMRTFSNLNIAVKCVEIDFELYQLLKEKSNRDVLIAFLLNAYFSISEKSYKFEQADDIFSIVSKDIIEGSAENYEKTIKMLEKNLDKESFEEEIFVRSSIFKREVIKLYDNTCCITGLRVDTTINASLLDACHIIPFSVSHNDTITNGLSLCPNMHRAFDRGLISIDENYRVAVSNKFNEPKKSVYSIDQFKGSQILLPENVKHYPSQQNFEWHRKQYGF